MTRPEPLPDTWFSRDFLILREVARRVEAGESLQATDVAQALDMDPRVVGKAGFRLKEDGFLKGGEAMGRGVIRFIDVTAQGRREVGQWPSADVAADRLMAALEQAIVNAPDEEQRTRLQKVRDGLTKAGRDVIVGIATGVATGQLGG
ncbi:hypothetical protein [Blastococcus sp. LR1]|uniref:hypothetical protein n=1 Tax=Blastococcus sp. LR1 TaxID=2877000 RepID=UPI001CCD7DD8|nr:hypothetical protein [Blastococcus sp. LR1]MCA0143765.1 hypothetical protein [Blastococcus sp. LR1]